ncbi:MAG TPA: (2Fe-2S) ferredoxin domain-containing protein [Pseudobacteroides sp.]|uniref:(2Fe-2S) ferredoxin domain-containing protein n=1 Tax=Pseudobacteroides sp. TaxID=1968840 RepID=UPI002F95D388
MKSITELEELRKKALEKMGVRANTDGYRIVVGMATCGIAAGARPVMNSFMEELQKREIKNASVTMTGCVGVCRLEPIVEVIDPSGNKTTYVKMTSEKAVRIVAEHIVNGRVCLDYTIGYEDKK